MKTRIVFEPSDFEDQGLGQLIIRNSHPRDHVPTGSPPFASAVSYKVGYNPGNGFALIALSDGQIRLYASLADLCEFLNNDQLGFRPMTVEELKSVAEDGNRFKE